MRIDVMLPGLGEDTDEEAKIAVWLVEEGDFVDEGDDLLEVTTDKAAFAVPSPVTGTVVEVCIVEGEFIRVGDILCILETIDNE